MNPEDAAAPRDARARCAVCGGTARRTRAMDLGTGDVYEGWRCRDCDLAGSVLRDPSTGRPLRLPHVLTGEGFVYAGE